MIIFGQGSCIRCIRAKWLYSGKSASYREKVALFGQKWLNSGKSGCIQAIVVVFVRVVLFGQKLWCSCKMVFFGQKLIYSGNKVVFGQNWLY